MRKFIVRIIWVPKFVKLNRSMLKKLATYCRKSSLTAMEKDALLPYKASQI